MASFPALLPLSPSLPPQASWGVVYDQPTEEEGTWVWFTEGSAQVAGTTHNAANCNSGKSLRTVVKGNTPSGPNCKQAPGCSFCLEGKNGQRYESVSIHRLWPTVWLDELGRGMIGKQGRLGKGFVTRPF